MTPRESRSSDNSSSTPQAMETIKNI